MPTVLTNVRSVGPYAGWIRDAIIRFKYEGEWARAEQLGPLLADALSDMSRCDALVPVPLHSRRYRQRGYNQSRLLAEQAGRRIEIGVRDVLVRQRATVPQVRLGAAARMANVGGAFALRLDEQVKGQDLVLVDDVITTGSTLAACATVLLDAGAKSVGVLTVARELQSPRSS
jgi:ComF family protein